MGQSIEEIQQLLKEAVAHLQAGGKADKRKAADKLDRLAAVASTLALTIRARQ